MNMKLVTESPKQVLIKTNKKTMFSIQTFPSVVRYSCFYLPSASTASSKFSSSHLKFTSPTYWPLCKTCKLWRCRIWWSSEKPLPLIMGSWNIYLSIYLQTFAFLVKIQMFFIYLYCSCIKNFYWILLHSNWKFNSAFCLLPQLGINNILISFLNGSQPC